MGAEKTSSQLKHWMGNAILILLGLLVCTYSATQTYLRFNLAFPYMIHDDTGWIMINLRDFSQGGKLFDEIPATYGPLHFLAWEQIYLITGLPINTNTFRLITAAFSFSIALLMGWYVGRLTLSWIWALLTVVLATRQLSALATEPGHPQVEIFLLWLLSLHLLVVWPMKWRASAPLWFGGAAGALAVLKLNTSVFFVLSVFMFLVQHGQRGVVSRITRQGLALLVLTLPLLLMRHRLDQEWVLYYCAFNTLALFPFAILLYSSPSRATERVGIRDGLSFLGAALGIIMLVTLVLMIRGSSLNGSIHGAFTQYFTHPHFVTDYFVPTTFGPIDLCWGVFGGLTMLWIGTRGVGSGSVQTFVQSGWLTLVKGIAVGVFLFLASVGYQGQLWIASFLWLLPLRPFSQLRVDSPRLYLGLLGCWNTLLAYPVAGSQAAFSTTLMMLAVVVLLADSLEEAAEWARMKTCLAAARTLVLATFLTSFMLGLLLILFGWPSIPSSTAYLWDRFLGLIPAAVLGGGLGGVAGFLRRLWKPHEGASWFKPFNQGLIGIILFCLGHAAWTEWQSTLAAFRNLPTLQLAGAEELRVDEADAALFRWLRWNTHQKCDALLTLPGMYSINFFTEVDPPTYRNITFWTSYLTPEQQRELLYKFDEAENPMLITNPLGSLGWVGSNIHPNDLRSEEVWDKVNRELAQQFESVRLLQERFSPLGRVGDVELHRRRASASERFRLTYCAILEDPADCKPPKYNARLDLPPLPTGRIANLEVVALDRSTRTRNIVRNIHVTNGSGERMTSDGILLVDEKTTWSLRFECPNPPSYIRLYNEQNRAVEFVPFMTHTSRGDESEP